MSVLAATTSTTQVSFILSSYALFRPGMRLSTQHFADETTARQAYVDTLRNITTATHTLVRFEATTVECGNTSSYTEKHTLVASSIAE